MSRAIFEAPITFPISSLIGQTASETSSAVPSLRRKTVSATKDTLCLRAKPFDDSQLFIVAIGRDQNCDRFADNFISAVAKKPFRFLVPTGDYFVEIFAYDRITRRFNDRSQAAVSFLGAFSLRDIA